MPIKLPSFRSRRDAYPPDLWTKCPSCEEMLFNKQLDKAHRVCPTCGHHFRLSAQARLELLLDPGTFEEHDAGLTSEDPLGFVDQKAYPDRVAAAQVATGLRDAAVWGTGRIEGRRVAICVMDFGFMGGSMGAVVGEKVARAAEGALAERIPLIVVSASGGARMQEGTLALMQLAKTMAALERLRSAAVPYISIMTDPTTGGVFASFAAVGDLNLAEPNALIGFAGARVNAGTIAAELPAGFQRAEFLFSHGFVDRIVSRTAMRAELIGVLRFLVAPDDLRPAPPPEPTVGSTLRRPLSAIGSFVDRVLPEDVSVNGGSNGTSGRGAPGRTESTRKPAPAQTVTGPATTIGPAISTGPATTAGPTMAAPTREPRGGSRG